MTGLDYAALPAELFHAVSRLQIRVGEHEEDAFRFFDDKEFKTAESKVMAHEKVQNIQDASWRKEVDVNWLKGLLENSHLGLKEEEYSTTSWKELEHTINTELGGRVVVQWSVAMIMATRN